MSSIEKSKGQSGFPQHHLEFPHGRLEKKRDSRDRSEKRTPRTASVSEFGSLKVARSKRDQARIKADDTTSNGPTRPGSCFARRVGRKRGAKRLSFPFAGEKAPRHAPAASSSQPEHSTAACVRQKAAIRVLLYKDSVRRSRLRWSDKGRAGDFQRTKSKASRGFFHNTQRSRPKPFVTPQNPRSNTHGILKESRWTLRSHEPGLRDSQRERHEPRRKQHTAGLPPPPPSPTLQSRDTCVGFKGIISKGPGSNKWLRFGSDLGRWCFGETALDAIIIGPHRVVSEFERESLDDTHTRSPKLPNRREGQKPGVGRRKPTGSSPANVLSTAAAAVRRKSTCVLLGQRLTARACVPTRRMLERLRGRGSLLRRTRRGSPRRRACTSAGTSAVRPPRHPRRTTPAPPSCASARPWSSRRRYPRSGSPPPPRPADP